jgi:thiamine biosynthesis protein ThiI
VSNIKASLAGVSGFKYCGHDGGALLFKSDQPVSDEEVRAVSERLGKVFGISVFMFAERCGSSMEELIRLMDNVAPTLSGTFKVVTRRRDKDFPLGSIDVSAQLGAAALRANSGLRVDVHYPDHEIRVSIERGSAFLAARVIPGPGGLPNGISGKVACLLSGGIDSPVAAWKLMRRGCRAVPVHFHSYPYVGAESLDKAERLAGVLAAWQGPTRLWLVPLADAQREIAAGCDESMRVVLYRRMMLRIAERIADREGAAALVTGDAVGQVASQTLDNIRTVSEAASLPIFRPLIGDDKEDIIRAARAIGSFGVSIEPHGDCCSLFMPRKPATHAKLRQALDEEGKLDVAGLAAAALQAAELKIIQPAR